MVNIILLSCFAVSYLVTFVFTPIWIRRAKKAGIVGKDMHKPKFPLIPEMGGITVLMGFVDCDSSHFLYTENKYFVFY